MAGALSDGWSCVWSLYDMTVTTSNNLRSINCYCTLSVVHLQVTIPESAHCWLKSSTHLLPMTTRVSGAKRFSPVHRDESAEGRGPVGAVCQQGSRCRV